VGHSLFLTVFSLIFVAELPDKTALIILLMATKGRPWPLFWGVALAFLVQNIVAVVFGRAISLLPEYWVHLAAGIMFFVFAVQNWRSAAKPEDEDEATQLAASGKSEFWQRLGRAFVVIFIAEWGDLTQLATASFTAQYPQQMGTVFVASTAALWSVTGVIIGIGQRFKSWGQSPWLKKGSAVAFACIGVYFIVKA
jgi:putative Ca2+/H+ antiporter (TMEM165/GDT1 family)